MYVLSGVRRIYFSRGRKKINHGQKKNQGEQNRARRARNFFLPPSFFFAHPAEFDSATGAEQTRGALESAPPDSFFQLGHKHTISNFRGGISSGGAYAPPVLKQGGHMHTVPHGCARLCMC